MPDVVLQSVVDCVKKNVARTSHLGGHFAVDQLAAREAVRQLFPTAPPPDMPPLRLQQCNRTLTAVTLTTRFARNKILTERPVIFSLTNNCVVSYFRTDYSLRSDGA